MEWRDAQRMAASATSSVLKAHHVQHAFIGGFAVQMLGGSRLTEDIDVEIDMGGNESRQQIVQHLLAADSRFSTQGAKLFFTPVGAPEHSVPIETLPIGSLGLPPTLNVIYHGDDQIPILRPSVLVLTKIKRCVQFIGSTRPKSQRKFEADLVDIEHLLSYLVSRGEKIDFTSYSSPNPERLYKAVGDLFQYYRSNEVDGMVDALLSVLEESDRTEI
ncbi:hypothetical protein V8C35DRAFT_325587 [Trichoderma chlorosporum]